MEGVSTLNKQAKGRNNLEKENWEGLDYMNDNNITKYCQAKLYPYCKFLPTGWNKYSRDNAKTLSCNVLKLVAILDGKKKEWYWFDEVAPATNKKSIDTRSDNRGSCHNSI